MAALTKAAILALGGPLVGRAPGSLGGSTPPRALRDLTRDALTLKARGDLELLILGGGEPTARRDLPSLLKLSGQLGLAPGLVTDGRLLRLGALRELLLERRVAYLRVGLQGATAPAHDEQVRSEGAFEETVAGLRAVLAEGPPELLVDVATTVTALSVGQLSSIVELTASWPRRATLGLRLGAPVGGLDDEEWPAMSSAEVVAEALGRATRRGSDIVVTWEGFPPCWLPDLLAPLRDESLRYAAPLLGPPEALGPLLREAPGTRRHPLPCQDCLHLPSCPGAPKTWLERSGEASLRPTRHVQANAFNYELDRELPDFRLRAGDCSASALSLDDGPLRSVLLAEGESVQLYHTPTRDFSDAQLSRVKVDLEQLYIDRSAEAALDDFTVSVRRLRFHGECRGCPDREGCPRTVVADEEEPFAREERWLRKEVSRLRGRVLDVGCGEQLYLDEVERLLSEGEIEYTGLDPDAETLERLRGEGFDGELIVGEIESYEGPDQGFDYVLVLRSLNHFRDVERAFEVICRVLRPQGQLVLCDSPPFGLLRTPAQVAHADEHARHGHEHYRNWDSHQVVELAKRFPLRLDVHRPVSTKTSNQWILKYMRAADQGPRAGSGR